MVKQALEIGEAEARALRELIDYHAAERRRIFPGRNSFTPEMMAQLPPDATNEEKSALEVYEFIHDVPTSYFLYVSESHAAVTTWMGDYLGRITDASAVWESNMGDKRQNITIAAINGHTYYGTYYRSAGDYARVKLVKGQ